MQAIMIRHHVRLRQLIWVCTICLCPRKKDARHIWVKNAIIFAEIMEVYCLNNLPSESALGTPDLSKLINMELPRLPLGEHHCSRVDKS